MEENSSSSADLKSQWMLARLLLVKYGIMHSFHEQQLQYYLIGCCNIALDGGSVSIDGRTKTVTFNVLTEKKFKKEGKKTVPRNKVSAFFAMSPSRYNEERSIAFKNLKQWCESLMWGDQTHVIVNIDGNRQYE